jgi:hypothetical protein
MMGRGEFVRLTRIWKDATSGLSSVQKTIDHPAYKQIVAAGECVIPFILKDLKYNGGHWFIALGQLSGENPTLEKFKDRMSCEDKSPSEYLMNYPTYDECVDAWWEWGVEKGYVSES